MDRQLATTERLRNLILKLADLTKSKDLRWERQAGSAHRFARWNNNLLILGPTTPPSDTSVPRYLFITPFDSPDCIEVNSEDAELGSLVTRLIKEVDDATADQPASDPFSINPEILERLEQ